VPPPCSAALFHDHFKKWKLINIAIQGNCPIMNFMWSLAQKGMQELEIGQKTEEERSDFVSLGNLEF
jgi:hypothetical protein